MDEGASPIQPLPRLLNFKPKPSIANEAFIQSLRLKIGYDTRWFAPWHLANKLVDVVHAVPNCP